MHSKTIHISLDNKAFLIGLRQKLPFSWYWLGMIALRSVYF